MKIQNLY